MVSLIPHKVFLNCPDYSSVVSVVRGIPKGGLFDRASYGPAPSFLSLSLSLYLGFTLVTLDHVGLTVRHGDSLVVPISVE